MRLPLAATLALSSVLFSACASRGPTRAEPGRTQRGIASWYGDPFHGRPTASGEIYDMDEISAAHKTLPLGTTVEVTNLDNGHSLIVRINDRGPFVRGRIIDLSRAAAQELGMRHAGLAEVRLTVVEGPSSAGDRNLWVQVGAFRDSANAEQLLGELRTDFPAVVIVGDGELHRVQIPTRGTRKRAASVQRALRKRGYESVLVLSSGGVTASRASGG